jgi:ribose transport system substrate-binding protein
MLKSGFLLRGLLASSAILALGVAAAQADDAYMAKAKEYIATVTAPVTAWTGPTSGPKAQGKKLVV